MMKKWFTLLACLSFIVSPPLLAQVKPVVPDSIKAANDPVFSLLAQEHVPKPPKTVQSPNAATLGAYGEIDVSPFTGKPEINVPLHQVSSGNVQIPVALHYDAAGVRPDMHPGWTGLNFGLSTNYSIVRTVRDGPDEFNVPGVALEQLGYLFTNTVINGNNWALPDTIRKTALTVSKQPGAQNGTFVDTEPDEYSFSFPGLSGKFYYGSDGKWKVQCDRPIKVERITEPNIHLYTPFTPPASIKNGNSWTNLGHYMEHFQGFVITDDFGVKYVFGGSDMAFMEYSINFFEQGTDGWICNAWYLKSIIRPTGQVVNFTYERGDFVNQMYFSVYNKKSRINGGAWFSCANWSSLIGQYGPYHGKLISPVYLKEIASDNFKVKFLSSESTELRYANDIYLTYESKKIADGFSRLDFLTFLYDCYYPVQNNYPGGCGSPTLATLLTKLKWRKLDKIQVQDGSGSTIKEFEFTYNNIATERLMLLKIQEKSGFSVSKLPPFEFKYFSGGYSLPAYCKSHTDHWGFNNGKIVVLPNDYNALPTYGANFRGAPADENLYRVGSLTEIKYPTGGITKFLFEPHRYAKEVKLKRWEGEDTFASNQTAGGLRIKEISSYDPGLPNPAVTKKFFYLATFNPANPDTSATALSSGVLGGKAQYFWPDYKPLPDSPGITVEEEIFSTQSVLPASENSMGSHVGYSQVIERSSTEGWTVHKFSNFDNGYRDEAPSGFLQPGTSPYQPYNNKAFMRGKALSEERYEQSGKIVSKKTQLFSLVGGLSDFSARSVKTSYAALCNTANAVFEGTAYVIDCRKYLPTEISDFVYDQDNPALAAPSILNNTYWSTGQLYIAAQGDSRGRKIKTWYQYPSTLPDIISTAMAAKNIVAPVREMLQYTGNEAAPVSIKATNFIYDLFAGSYQPQKVQSKISKAPFFNTDIDFLTYDARGNLLTYREIDGLANKLEYFGPADIGKADLLKKSTIADGTTSSQSSSYTYKPAIGVETVQDANGKTIFYEFDQFSRLRNERTANAGGVVRASYCYNLAGQAVECAALAPNGSVAASTLLLIAESALPVTLIDFLAIRQEKAVQLSWTTSGEASSDRFEIERSADGIHWESVGSVPAQGDSGGPRDYGFTDKNPLAGENLYRLKMLDLDGTFTYSRIRSVTFSEDQNITIYPNPLSIDKSLRIETSDPSLIADIRIYDLNGKQVFRTSWKPEIDLRALSTGLYLLQISFSDASVTSRRIVKQ